jgi:hypothetical protein
VKFLREVHCVVPPAADAGYCSRLRLRHEDGYSHARGVGPGVLAAASHIVGRQCRGTAGAVAARAGRAGRPRGAGSATQRGSHSENTVTDTGVHHSYTGASHPPGEVSQVRFGAFLRGRALHRAVRMRGPVGCERGVLRAVRHPVSSSRFHHATSCRTLPLASLRLRRLLERGCLVTHEVAERTRRGAAGGHRGGAQRAEGEGDEEQRRAQRSSGGGGGCDRVAVPTPRGALLHVRSSGRSACKE